MVSIYIGIDSGTQSTKGVAFDLERGAVIAEARAPHSLIAGLPPGHMEQRPQEWTAALDHVVAEVAESKSTGLRVRGIGVSGRSSATVSCRSTALAQVIRPAKLWCDTSTAPECAWLTKKSSAAPRP